jgi:hypothetical protein
MLLVKAAEKNQSAKIAPDRVSYSRLEEGE